MIHFEKLLFCSRSNLKLDEALKFNEALHFLISNKAQNIWQDHLETNKWLIFYYALSQIRNSFIHIQKVKDCKFSFQLKKYAC